MPEASTQARDILDRWSALKSRRSSWEEHWQDVLDYILPQRTPVNRASRIGCRLNRSMQHKR